MTNRGAIVACVLLGAPAASAQSISGSGAAFRTTGTTAGPTYTLTENGYVGTYLTLAAPATVDFSLSASGASAGGTAPRMNLVINDAKFGWDVSSSSSSYTASVALPAGTHFVRTELANGPVGSGRSLSINSLSASGAGVGFSNNDNRANALAAANTYIDNYRKGSATVALRGPGDVALLPGTSVNMDLTRHAFNFGTAIAGFNGAASLTTNATYAQRVNQHFNAVVPENAGKWGSNSSGTTPPPPGSSGNISYSNAILSWAQQNDKRARMHNLIWGNQQPAWVNNMLANAGSHTTLRSYVSDRIKYYVGDANDGNPNDDPATRYLELDVYNESVHTQQYWNAYGAAGVADIYREVRDAANSVGAEVRLYANEYNVLQWSGNGGNDTYANWYRRNIEQINNAGQGEVVTGVGVQYYADTSANAAGAGQAHNVSFFQRALQNLSVTGVPITLTEFGIQSGAGQTTNQTTQADILEDTVRMLFGTPQATGFFMWGFYQGNGYIWNQATGGAFYDAAWNLRQPGARWNALMSQWDTNVNAIVNPDGTVTFTGFFGDYSIGGESGALTLAKGQSDYTVTLVAPPDWHFWGGASGAWDTSANWTNGAPGGVGHTAHFGAASGSPVVTVAAPVTVGMVNFDNAVGYTIAGPAAITMSGPAGIAAINVVSGSHTIAATVALESDLLVNVRPAGSTLAVSGPLLATARAITKSGAGAAQVENVRAASLDVRDGTVRISAKPVAADPSGTGVVSGLTLSATARLDLTNNAFVVDHAPADDEPLDTIRALIVSARGGGAWDGQGITSSLADANRFAVGYAASAAVFTTFPATFAGQTVDDSAVLIRFTRYGDANLDGAVNLQDFNRLASAFGSSGALWNDGDFNFDGDVSLQDFNLLASNFGLGAAGPGVTPQDWSALASAVPEPASPTFALLLCTLAARRRRS